MAKKNRQKFSLKKKDTGLISQKKRDLTIVVGLAVLLRIIYDIHLTDNPLLSNYILDSLVLHSWAQEIIAGNTADIAFFRAPLYPYLLATTYKIFGLSHWGIVFVQNILGILTSVVIYLFASDLFGRKTALWSGLIVAAYPTLIYFEGEIMITSLAVFLYTLAFYLSWLAAQKPDINRILLAGLAFGTAAIARPTILPLLVVFPAALIIRSGIGDWKRSLTRTMIFGVAVIVPILPVTLTNLVKGNEFVLISTQGGVNFYIGNCNDADGITVQSPGPNYRIGNYQDNIWTSSIDEAERRTGRKLSQNEISSFWLGETIDQISKDIPGAIKLYLRKLYMFWHGQEIFNNKSLYYSGEYSWLSSIFLWKAGLNFPSGLILPLMFVGIFLAWRNRSDMFVPAASIILFSLSMALFFVCARFRQPIMPVAIMFASYGLTRIFKYASENRKALIRTLASTGLLVVVFNLGGDVESAVNRSQFEAILGSVQMKLGQYEKAVSHLERSITMVPDNVQVYDWLGTAYMELKKLDQAEATYLKGAELFPTYPLFNFGLGRIAQVRSEEGKAKEYYRLTVKHSPQFGPALDRLGFLFVQEKQPDSAIFYYEKLLKVQGRNSQLEERIRSLRQELDGTQ